MSDCGRIYTVPFESVLRQEECAGHDKCIAALDGEGYTEEDGIRRLFRGGTVEKVRSFPSIWLEPSKLMGRLRRSPRQGLLYFQPCHYSDFLVLSESRVYYNGATRASSEDARILPIPSNFP